MFKQNLNVKKFWIFYNNIQSEYNVYTQHPTNRQKLWSNSNTSNKQTGKQLVNSEIKKKPYRYKQRQKKKKQKHKKTMYRLRFILEFPFWLIT